jgi:two-component system, OmpR family, response regulator
LSAEADRKLILVADDDEDFLNLVTLRLEQDGHRVERASSGSEALRKAREADPDLCVFDVMMPGLTGFEVLRELRSQERTEEMPVMLLTASLTDREAFEGAAVSAADDWMRKPFSTDEFRARVRALLGRGGGPDTV